jgi:hypothetical protein
MDLLVDGGQVAHQAVKLVAGQSLARVDEQNLAAVQAGHLFLEGTGQQR